MVSSRGGSGESKKQTGSDGKRPASYLRKSEARALRSSVRGEILNIFPNKEVFHLCGACGAARFWSEWDTIWVWVQTTEWMVHK